MTTSRVLKSDKVVKGRSLGQTIDELHELRESKRALEQQIKILDEKYGELEDEIVGKMNEAGLDKMTGKKGTVSITSSIVANVPNWDEFWKWVAKTKNFHMIQKRVSDPSWREYCEKTGKTPPGTESFSKRRLNLRGVADKAA